MTEKPTLRKIKRGASQHTNALAFTNTNKNQKKVSKAYAFAPHLILPQSTQDHPLPYKFID